MSLANQTKSPQALVGRYSEIMEGSATMRRSFLNSRYNLHLSMDHRYLIVYRIGLSLICHPARKLHAINYIREARVTKLLRLAIWVTGLIAPVAAYATPVTGASTRPGSHHATRRPPSAVYCRHSPSCSPPWYPGRPAPAPRFGTG